MKRRKRRKQWPQRRLRVATDGYNMNFKKDYPKGDYFFQIQVLDSEEGRKFISAFDFYFRHYTEAKIIFRRKVFV